MSASTSCATQVRDGVLRREIDGWWDPEAVFTDMARRGAATVWRDPDPDQDPVGFLGCTEEDADVVVLRGASALLDRSDGDPMRSVRRLVGTLRARSAAMAARSALLGWWGAVGYELGAVLHDLPLARGETLAMFAWVDRGIEFDLHRRTVALVVLASAPDAESWLHRTAEGLREIPVRLAPPDANGCAPRWRWRHERPEYLDRIAACQEAIHRGDAYQVCLTNTITVDLGPRPDPVAIARRLRRIAPAPYGGVLRVRDRWLLSASPEQLLAVDPLGRARTRPMKGTRPRGADPDADCRLAAQLLASEKERAENLMIVDLMRNDLSRVSEVGSVSVPQLFAVESHPYAHQLVSTVDSVLATDAVDALLALFPAGSMTGAPKRSAMRILDELEGGARGLYSGAWGRLPLDGSLDLAVVIRSVVIQGSTARIGTGGGITALSRPEEEWEEVELKARPTLAAVGARAPRGR